jgi:hypothetical protein
MKDIFTDIIANRWWDPNVPCGSGSSLEYTQLLRDALPDFLVKHGITSMLDAPCGDHSWMSLIQFPSGFSYMGGDIVEFLIDQNKKQWPNKEFTVFDLTQDHLPDVDLLFCRDCLFHLSEKDLVKVFDNIRSSSVKYIMTTSYKSGHYSNHDIKTGSFRPINLELAPFNLPVPVDRLDDGVAGAVIRELCLWHKDDFTDALK